MRLLNVETFELHEFFEEDIPPYSILSHRWGKDEVSYHDFINGLKRDGAGFKKIRELCAVVKARNILDFVLGQEPYAVGWVWIDTCCIDKTSSSELSEAINSMYQWYSDAQECLVYLADVPFQDGQSSDLLWETFADSEWFTRGWTLQELLAPRLEVFYSSSWHILGYVFKSFVSNGISRRREAFSSWTAPERLEEVIRNLDHHDNIQHHVDSGKHDYGNDLSNLVSQITGIHVDYLSAKVDIREASVAKRMSWASQRRTTRREDMAYCLLGLFDVNMPLLYGEGERAFQRLQEEIIKRSSDQSIFTWCNMPLDRGIKNEPRSIKLLDVGLVAHHVSSFRYANDVENTGERPERSYSVTNLGLHMHLQSTRAVVAVADPLCVPHVVELAGVCLKDGQIVKIIVLQCLHDAQRMWYRSRSTDLLMSGAVSNELHFPTPRKEEEPTMMEVFAPILHTSWQQCHLCLLFDVEFEESVKALSSQQSR